MFDKSTYPFISVILPVYNAEKYILASIQSILSQTYSNFELIVLNDGSTDKSGEIIKEIDDSRIVYVEHPNCGLASTLNKGLGLAKGQFIARQDADDISYPQRFEKQIAFLRTHPQCGLLGTWAQIIDEKGNVTSRYHRHETENNSIKFTLCFDNSFVHSSVMFRKEVLSTVGNYDSSVHHLVQDYEYWFRISRKYQLANLSETLLDYREVGSSISRITSDFSRVVAEQSSQNLSNYFSPAQVLAPEILSSLHHGINLSHRLEQLRDFEIDLYLNQLINGLFGKQVPGRATMVLIKEYKSKFKYIQNAYLGFDTSKSLISRIPYKLKTRMFKLLNKNLS
jgi:glycosyltransferase involved in cell wall biosynthesis